LHALPPLRLLLRKWGNKPYLRIADFTISKEDALKYIAAADNAHHFKLSKWRDIHFSVYI